MTAPSPVPVQRQVEIAVLLSFVAGYVDTVGFIALFGLFTAHVTGNFVLIGASLVRSHAGFIAKLAALPLFVIVVTGVALFARLRGREGRPALGPLLVVQTLLLVGFAGAGIAAEPIVNADAPLAILAGLFGVAAMGVQNAYSRLLMNELPPTTVMTGSVTQLAIDIAHWLSSNATNRTDVRERLIRFASPVVAFALGAVGGALAYSAAGFPALLVPMLALLAVIYYTRRTAAAVAVGGVS